jgi:hypothetical protein
MALPAGGGEGVKHLGDDRVCKGEAQNNDNDYYELAAGK